LCYRDHHTIQIRCFFSAVTPTVTTHRRNGSATLQWKRSTSVSSQIAQRSHSNSDESDSSPVMIGQQDIVLSFGHHVMKKTELFMQVVMKSVVVTRTANVNCLSVIPDNSTSLTGIIPPIPETTPMIS